MTLKPIQKHYILLVINEMYFDLMWHDFRSPTSLVFLDNFDGFVLSRQ